MAPDRSPQDRIEKFSGVVNKRQQRFNKVHGYLILKLGPGGLLSSLRSVGSEARRYTHFGTAAKPKILEFRGRGQHRLRISTVARPL